MMSTSDAVDLEEQFRHFFPKTEFSSFEEFTEMFRQFQRATATSYVLKGSINMKQWLRKSRKIGLLIPETVKYKNVYFKCIHSAKKKHRQANSHRFEDFKCPSKVTLIYRNGKMRFLHVNLKHNHPIAKNNPEFYPRNRTLTPEQEAILSRVLDGDLSTGQIIEYIYMNFGIKVNAYDVRHILDRKRKSAQIEGEEVSYNNPVESANPGVLSEEPTTVLPVVPVAPPSLTSPISVPPITEIQNIITNTTTNTPNNNTIVTTKQQRILSVITELYNVLVRLQDDCTDEHLSFIQSYATHLSQSQSDVELPTSIVLEQPPSTPAQPSNLTPPKATGNQKRYHKSKGISDLKLSQPVINTPIQPVQQVPGLRPILPRPPNQPKVAIPVTLVLDVQRDPTNSAPPSDALQSPDQSPKVNYEDENEAETEEEEEESPEVTMYSSDEESLSSLLTTPNPKFSPDTASYVFRRKVSKRRKPVVVTRGSPAEIIDEYFPEN